MIKEEPAKQGDALPYFTFCRRHQFKTTYDHFQMCDSLTAISATELFFIKDNRVYHYNLLTKSAHLIVKVQSVYSIRAKYGHLGVCGMNVSLVYDLNSGTYKNLNIKGMNNYVDIEYSLNGSLLFAFANNDQFVTLCAYNPEEKERVEDCKVVMEHTMPNCVNNTTLSNNGKYMLSTLDGRRMCLDKLDKDYGKQQLLNLKLSTAFSGINESPQYCCWTNDCEIFAVTTDCGSLIWWRRSDLTKPIGIYQVDKGLYNVLFVNDDTMIAVVSRSTLYIVPINNFTQNNVQKYKIERGKITGICSPPNSHSLFVSHTRGIDEFKLVTVPSLVDLCVNVIMVNQESKWKNFDWTNIPSELYMKIFPTSMEVKIKFEDEEDDSEDDSEDYREDDSEDDSDDSEEVV